MQEELFLGALTTDAAGYPMDTNEDETLVFQGTLVEAKTQKARGVLWLEKLRSRVMKWNLDPSSLLSIWHVPKHLLFPIRNALFGDHSFNFPVFARPCPTVPRHGFVDSRVCPTAKELEALIEETKTVEEEAELLVTKPIDAHYNVVFSNGALTIGPGNDGATQGKGCFFLYANEDPLSEMLGLANEKDILLEGESPFYEIVIPEKPLAHLVQVRSAPSMPAHRDFIPAETKVQKVIEAKGDLLEWETLLKNVDPKTTAIDHSGGSLASHFAIHAVINNIPILTTRPPLVGETLLPISKSTSATAEDTASFRKAFSESFHGFSLLGWQHIKDKTHKMRDVVRLALAVLHNFPALAQQGDYALLGTVLGAFCRVCFAVSLGEARYAKGKGSWGGLPHLSLNKGDIPGERNECYGKALGLSGEESVAYAKASFYLFRDMAWSGAYGGPKWADCTWKAISLYNMGVAGEIKQASTLFNRVINAYHNGGHYLSKCIHPGEFNKAAANGPAYLLKHLPFLVHSLGAVKAQAAVATGGKALEPIGLLSKDKPDPGPPKMVTDGSGMIVGFVTDTTKHVLEEGLPLSKELEKACWQGEFELASVPRWWGGYSGGIFHKIISKAKFNKLPVIISEEAEKEHYVFPGLEDSPKVPVFTSVEEEGDDEEEEDWNDEEEDWMAEDTHPEDDGPYDY